MSMNAVEYSEFGDPSKVVYKTTAPIPDIGPKDILVKTVLSCIHNHNYVTIMGQYGFKPQLPYIDGSEGYGTVAKLGSEVKHLKVGQRVATARAGSGTWAEYFVADAATTIPVPDSVDDETAAQIYSMPLSAFLLLDFIGVKKGEWFAYNAANGVVGKVMAQAAKQRGVNMLKLVRSDAAKKQLEELGLDSVVVYTTDNWQEQVKTVTGCAPIKAAVDNVGGKQAVDLLHLLCDDGVLTLFGRLTKDDIPLSTGDLLFSHKKIQGYWVSSAIKNITKEKLGQTIGEVVRLFASGTLKLPAGAIYSFDDAAKGLTALSESKGGKILLRP